ATPPLSLPDALPISLTSSGAFSGSTRRIFILVSPFCMQDRQAGQSNSSRLLSAAPEKGAYSQVERAKKQRHRIDVPLLNLCDYRSEEHTSELQSRFD